MQPPTAARNAISPLLEELIRQLDSQGHSTKGAYFARIRKDLDHAQDELALLTPIRALSTFHAVGLELSDDAELLMQRILLKTSVIAAALETTTPTRH